MVDGFALEALSELLGEETEMAEAAGPDRMIMLSGEPPEIFNIANIHLAAERRVHIPHIRRRRSPKQDRHRS